MDIIETLQKTIRDVPGFPKPGIVFKDITTILKDAQHFKNAINLFAERYQDKKIEIVVAVESRGFILGSALAYKLGAGFVPVRKKGKLPAKTISATYALEYGTDSIEMHQDAIKPGQRVLILDDLLATGGTAKAVIELVEKLKGEIVEIAFLVELDALKGREKLAKYPVYSAIHFAYEV
jgi:adenine phosphoribosyltransferase